MAEVDHADPEMTLGYAQAIRRDDKARERLRGQLRATRSSSPLELAPAVVSLGGRLRPLRHRVLGSILEGGEQVDDEHIDQLDFKS